MDVKVRDLAPIFVVAAIVVATDAIVMPILRQSVFFPEISTMTVLAIDFSVVLLTGLAGLLLAPRVGSPHWRRPTNGSSA
jgi:hypothetical protein